MKRPSLTVQILKGVGLPFLLVTVLIGAIAWFSAQDEISEVYDSQLITSAQELWQLTTADDDPRDFRVGEHDLGLDPEDQASLDEYSKWRSFRVWLNGQETIRSDNAPPATVAAGPRGFRDVTRDGARWRVFTLIMPADHVVVEVSEKLRARWEVSGRIVWGVSLPLLLVFPVIVLAVWLGIRWGLRDLRGFAAAVRQRSPDDLAHIDSGGLPREIAPLSEAINHLLTKLEISRGQERLFTDNAAHELRTPLAALSVQADVARNARNARERNQTLDALSLGVQRTSRLLDQLLTLARISHAPAETASLNLYDAVREALVDAYAKAHVRGIQLALVGDDGAMIDINRPLLDLLVGNLLDNAIKYSPQDAAIDVNIARAGDRVDLVLRDRGTGIPEGERDKVFGRFYRVKGNVEAGSGLGLAIVRTICDIAGAEVHLFTPDDGVGLGVRLRFFTAVSASAHLESLERRPNNGVSA